MENPNPDENKNEKEVTLNEELQELADMPSFGEFRKTVEQKKTTSVSDMYAEIAKNVLVYRDGLSDEEADEKIANSSYEELEKQIGAESSILAATESIARRLHIDETKMKEAIFNGGDESVFEEAREEVKRSYNDEWDYEEDDLPNRERLVLEVLSDVHDRWCADNEEEFFDKEQFDKRYRFLDLNLIGYDKVMAYSLPIEPIFEKIGIEIDEMDELDSQYRHGSSFDDTLRDEYLIPIIGDEDDGAGTGCEFAETLYETPERYLSKGVSGKVREAIKGDFKIAAEMTMQVGEKGSGDDYEADWGSLWAYHERGEDGVFEYYDGDFDPFYNTDNDPYFNSKEYINDGWE